VNALDAAFVAYAGISALRQQIRPEQRVHGVISGRDWTPNGSFDHHRHHHHVPPASPRASKTKYEGLTTRRLIVIPDYAKMKWSVRADAWGALEPLRERVVKCLECVRVRARPLFGY
jgi:hypothetical protein